MLIDEGASVNERRPAGGPGSSPLRALGGPAPRQIFTDPGAGMTKRRALAER